ncbi:CPG4 domain-containing protein [Meloidogyne graminicola]|uniref:CPG4 domain-containing protein n=1 Tax=Meloidogyne graminicola TaxID=189291 RepID=A0A8S9ZM08_9BILA|nr:CPG4 domain-containing protein [Meloidogyne graminicola]
MAIVIWGVVENRIDNYEPVCLASSFIPNLKQKEEAYVAGYGGSSLQPKSNLNYTLKEAKVKIAKTGTGAYGLRCQIDWGRKSKICSVSTDKGAYTGDSGGGIHTKIIIFSFSHGISSAFKTANNKLKSVVYADIATHCAWISEITLGEVSCFNPYEDCDNKILSVDSINRHETQNNITYKPENLLVGENTVSIDDGVLDYYINEKKTNNSEYNIDSEEVNVPAINFLPLCQRECLGKLSEAAKSAIQSSNNYERYKGVCLNYKETWECIDELEGEQCRDQLTFNLITSGLRYLCIEKKKAFEAVIGCIDAQADQVEEECESVCHLKEKILEWSNQSKIIDNSMKAVIRNLKMSLLLKKMLLRIDQTLGILIGNELHRNVQILKAALEGAKKIKAENVINDGCDIAQCQLNW